MIGRTSFLGLAALLVGCSAVLGIDPAESAPTSESDAGTTPSNPTSLDAGCSDTCEPVTVLSTSARLHALQTSGDDVVWASDRFFWRCVGDGCEGGPRLIGNGVPQGYTLHTASAERNRAALIGLKTTDRSYTLFFQNNGNKGQSTASLADVRDVASTLDRTWAATESQLYRCEPECVPGPTLTVSSITRLVADEGGVLVVGETGDPQQGTRNLVLSRCLVDRCDVIDPFAASSTVATNGRTIAWLGTVAGAGELRVRPIDRVAEAWTLIKNALLGPGISFAFDGDGLLVADTRSGTISRYPTDVPGGEPTILVRGETDPRDVRATSRFLYWINGEGILRRVGKKAAP